MKILAISDFDLRGSGYYNIISKICQGLAEKGHDVKALGLSYRGEEHWFDFTIIPVSMFSELPVLVNNLKVLWEPDVMIVALDTHHQEPLVYQTNNIGIPYIGIMPIEADPLCLSWSMVMIQMSKVFIISEFGRVEAEKVGVSAEHLVVGVDTEFWNLPTKEDKEIIRESMGLQDSYVVLTIADNQERKNLSRTMDIIAAYKEVDPSVYWLLVTREHASIGWKLRDYAQEVGISDRIMIFERGIPNEQLRDLMWSADTFLLTSKAEGLGMPVLEAMAVGLPVVATGCTGMLEQVQGGRGFAIEYEYKYRDPFGNGFRYFASKESGVEGLSWARSAKAKTAVKKARKYVEGRDWADAVAAVEKSVLEVTQ